MHGLERELGDRVEFIRVDLRSEVGDQISRLYDVSFAGTHVLLGSDGDELYRIHGIPDAEKIKQLVVAEI